jgi:type I restriction enzyme M protein
VDKQKYKADLIPPALIVAHYFAREQAAIDELQAQSEARSQDLEAFIEDHIGEEGLLEEAKTEKGKITRASLKARLAEIKGLSEFEEERKVLLRCQDLLEAEAEAESTVKEAQKLLDARVVVQYGKLTESDVKTLVVHLKWLGAIAIGIQEEFDRMTQRLAGRIKTLEERYAQPLPLLVDKVAVLSDRVSQHLHSVDVKLGSTV